MKSADGIRELATFLLALADDMDAGHARHVEGTFDFTIHRETLDCPIEKQPPRGLGKLPYGELFVTSDLHFLTGQPPLPSQSDLARSPKPGS